MQRLGLSTKIVLTACVLWAAGTAIIGSSRLNAQESLGEKARRIRAEKENAQAGQSDDGKKQMSPAAADLNPITQKSRAMGAPDLTATVGLIQESDPAKYQEDVRLMLEQERFRVLDDVAAGERVNKTRFAGGEWKLWAFYDALGSPAGKGRGVVADWNAYRDRLGRWVAQQPESVTARVALAQAELLYGWQLRGPGELGTVPQDHFDRFMAQVKQAETILNGAMELPVKCPEWYDLMLQVGRAKGWELQDLNTLLEGAVAFEPGYFYVYQEQALTLTPKWRGREGDAEKFAEEQANRVGGKAGDMLYWLIAESVIGNPELAKMPQHFVWSRALIGYQALVEQYGASTVRQNQIALMAARFGDYMTADDLLLQIGDRWDPGTWGSQEYFDKVKTWARSSAGPFKRIIEAYKAVNANVSTPEGQRYDAQIAKEFTARYARAVQDCTSGGLMASGGKSVRRGDSTLGGRSGRYGDGGESTSSGRSARDGDGGESTSSGRSARDGDGGGSTSSGRAGRDGDTGAEGTTPTLLILQVGKSGSVQQMLVVPETASDACLRPKLEKANFSPPPKPEYWVRVSLK
jgi:hypothetical protein